MYVNNYDSTEQCALRGQSAEVLFERWLRNNRDYRKATLEEQYKHIDFVIRSIHGDEITIDVKAPKKINRNDKSTSEDILWVEFVNVRGDKGWLYGDNDFIAFYIQKEGIFYVIETSKLASLCESLCNQGYTNSSKDALYKKYTRAGRKDVISMIKFDDIKTLPCWKLKVN